MIFMYKKEKKIKPKEIIYIIGYVILFLLVIIFQTLNGATSNHIRIGELELSFSAISGVLSQLQVMISIYLVVTSCKYAYNIIMVFNVLQVFMIGKKVFIDEFYLAIPGLFVPLSTIIAVTIIYKYQKRVHNQIKELNSTNEKLREYNELMREKEEKLNHLSFFDILTGLPNRRMIINRIEILVNLAQKNKIEFSVVFFDIDAFKKINDSLGHRIADMLLCDFSSRIKENINEEDIIGRLSGNEFAIIVQSINKKDKLFDYIVNLKKLLNEPFIVDSKEINISVSCGIAFYPIDGNNPEELMKSANAALHTAKETQSNSIQFFYKELKENIIKKIEIEKRLKSSIYNKEFFIAYQPQYNINKELRGFEALARWNSNDLGNILPKDFIVIAEETRYIIFMGEWMLRNACYRCKQINEKYKKDVMMSVNISAIQIMEEDFVKMVKKVIKETGVEPRLLEFEITESTLISSKDYVISILEELIILGIKIGLDDFGTGYSSLSYLQLFPINTLKLDKLFIDNIMNINMTKKIAGAIISLMHELDIEVVAEGVEHEEQLNYLKEHECDYIQGFLWSEPVDDNDLDKYLEVTLGSPIDL